jgi:hypothetical protein
LLAPLGQHERVDAQRLRHVLDQHPWLVAHLYGLELELKLVPGDLLRPGCSHIDSLQLGWSVN